MSTSLLQGYAHLSRGSHHQQQQQAQQQQLLQQQQQKNYSQVQPRVHVNPFQRQCFSPTPNVVPTSAQLNYNVETIHYRQPRQLGLFQTVNRKGLEQGVINSDNSASPCQLPRTYSASYVQQQQQRCFYAASPLGISSSSNLAQFNNASNIVVGRCARTELVLHSPHLKSTGASTLGYPLVAVQPEAKGVSPLAHVSEPKAANALAERHATTSANSTCSPAASYTPMQVLCAVCCLRTRVKEPVHIVHQDNRPFLWQSDISNDQEKMKKSISSTLRSPNVKRSVESPVTIRGWLYKQGSDGLMLWKKRWFVLSEYCLFYYKGPEEDKILGSILLPSYIITPCDSTDHIYRKFAFKAEHQNMRTYYFAAENKKEMQQWMNTMSLASILQNQNPKMDESLDRVSREMNNRHRREEEDSGFAMYQPRRQQQLQYEMQSNEEAMMDRHHHIMSDEYPNGYMMNDPEHSFQSDDVPYQPSGHNYLHNGSRYPVETRLDQVDDMMDYDSSNSGVPMMTDNSGFSQRPQHHLYANAPPKPKRMGGSRDLIYESHAEAIPLPSYHSAAANSMGSKPMSPFVETPGNQKHYTSPPGKLNRDFSPNLMSPNRRNFSEEYHQGKGMVVSQRRTPDPYARTAHSQIVTNDMSDKQYREDEYAATIAAVAGRMHVKSPQSDLHSPSHVQYRKYPHQKVQSVRPQSADFVESMYPDGIYKKLPQTHQRQFRNVLQRPLSSMDHQSGLSDENNGDLEHFKSGLKKDRNSPNIMYNEEKDSHSFRRVSENVYNGKENFIRQQNNLSNSLSNKSINSQSNSNINESFGQSSAQILATPTKSSNSSLQLDKIPIHQQQMLNQSTSPGWNRFDPNYTLPRDRNNFLRSYSARFSTGSVHSPQTDGYSNENSNNFESSSKSSGGSSTLKMQQREESMKRLLEWKQRMLQSPLTRKYIPKSDSTSTFQKQVHMMASSAATTPSSTMISALETIQNRQQQSKHRLSQPTTSALLTPDGTKMSRYSSGEEQRIPRTQSAIQVNQQVSNDGNSRFMTEMTKDRFTKTMAPPTSKSPSRLSNRIQDHRRSTSSLNKFYSSYSSDDEDQIADANFTRSQSVKIGKVAKKLRETVDYVNISSLNGNTRADFKVSTNDENDKGPEYVNLLGFQDLNSKTNMRYRCHSEPNFFCKNDTDENDYFANNEQSVNDDNLYMPHSFDSRENNLMEVERHYQDGSTQTVNQVQPKFDISIQKPINYCSLPPEDDDASSVDEVRMKDRMYQRLVLGNSCNRDWKYGSSSSKNADNGEVASTDDSIIGTGDYLALEPPEQFRSPVTDSSNMFSWVPCQPPKSRQWHRCHIEVDNSHVNVENNDSSLFIEEQNPNACNNENSANYLVQNRIKNLETQADGVDEQMMETHTKINLNYSEISNDAIKFNYSDNKEPGRASLCSNDSQIRKDSEFEENKMLPEEYYLPMNGSCSTSHVNTSDFRSFALDDEQFNFSKNIDDAVYVQMDNNSVLATSPKSVFGKHELLSNPTTTIQLLNSKDSSTYSSADFRMDSLSFDNFGYYQIPDQNDNEAEINNSNRFEPIYAEPGAQDDTLKDNFSVNSQHDEIRPTLPQRNNSLMMNFIISDNSKDRNPSEQLHSGIKVQEESPEEIKTSRSADLNDLNPRFSLSDSFRPASYYLKVANSTGDNFSTINQTNICPDMNSEIWDKQDQEIKFIKLDHSVNINTVGLSSAVEETKQNIPSLSPLHSNLNYSYYRVYEEGEPRSPSSELLTKPLAVSLPFKQVASNDSNQNEIQDSKINVKLPVLPNSDLKDAETQWSSTVSISSDANSEMIHETLSTSRMSLTASIASASSVKPTTPISAPVSSVVKRSPNSAPYYYSDIIKDDGRLSDPNRDPQLLPGVIGGIHIDLNQTVFPASNSSFRPLATYSTSRFSPLNNVSQPRLQTDVCSRKVSNIELAQNRSLQSAALAESVDVVDPLTAVTNQLTDSIVYWEAKKLSGAERNVYESDTLRKRAWISEVGTSRSENGLQSGSSGIDARNLYPQGILSEKLRQAVPRLNYSDTLNRNLPQRSRSLEGLLFGENSPPGIPTSNAPNVNLYSNTRVYEQQENSSHCIQNSNLNRAMSVGSCLNQSDRQVNFEVVNSRSIRNADNEDDGYQPSHDAVRFPGDGEDSGNASSNAHRNYIHHSHHHASARHSHLHEEVGLPIIEPQQSWKYFIDEQNGGNLKDNVPNEIPRNCMHNLSENFTQISKLIEPIVSYEPDRPSSSSNSKEDDSKFTLINHSRQSPIKWDPRENNDEITLIEFPQVVHDNTDDSNSESWSASSMLNENENWGPQQGLTPQQQRFMAKRKYRNDNANAVEQPTAQCNLNKIDSNNTQEVVNVSESLMDAHKKLQRMKFNLSAGDLLGKSHEELVLLLIQLRRDQTKLEHKLNKCRLELESKQRLIQMNSMNGSDQMISNQQMFQQYEEMNKQYELTKPLVNLVDNMVKLGSLYGTTELPPELKPRLEGSGDNSKKMLEFSRLLQEQRLQNNNQFSGWYHLQQLEQKLQEASQLDTVLLEESHAVSDLQQDKDMLEKVVENLRSKLTTCRDSPVELEKLQKQLRTAEKELFKIRSQLSQGAQKLEETAADNARIENEIGMLRQRVQSSIVHGLGNDNSTKASYIRVQLEKELSRISNVMEDLAWKRKELSGALEQLKERNKALLADVRASPTGVAGSAPLPNRKNHRSTYLETDLDTMETKDIIESWKQIEGSSFNDQKLEETTGIPLYVNTYESSTGSDDASTVTVTSLKEDIDSSLDSEHLKNESYEPQDIIDADDRTKRFYGLIPKDKPAEIKTVRIVKRESERRSKVRDRRKSDLDGDVSLMKIGEEPYETDLLDPPELTEVQLNHTMSLPRNFSQTLSDSNEFSSKMLGLKLSSNNNLAGTDSISTPSSTASGKNVSYYYRTPSLSSLNSESSSFSARDRLFGRPITSSHHQNCGFSSSPNSMATPTFKSETARKIVAEAAASEILSKQTDFIMHEIVAEKSEPEPATDIVLAHEAIKCRADGMKKKQKRRANTISSSQPLILETTMQRMVHARSRDDLDIEQCLRSANTPDVVKSTIKKNDMFDESTIDRELGLPQKILIPERYVEETSEEPSPAEQLHRLQKAESIRKMLSESSTFGDSSKPEEVQTTTLKKKFEADRRQREHLLALNQIIAKEVMERSKAVAARAMKNPPKVAKKKSEEELSPDHPLPFVQQRENLLT